MWGTWADPHISDKCLNCEDCISWKVSESPSEKDFKQWQMINHPSDNQTGETNVWNKEVIEFISSKLFTAVHFFHSLVSAGCFIWLPHKLRTTKLESRPSWGGRTFRLLRDKFSFSNSTSSHNSSGATCRKEVQETENNLRSKWHSTGQSLTGSDSHKCVDHEGS